MELATPLFLFLLLPLSLLILRLVPKSHRRPVLSAISILWFIIVNRKNLVGLLHVELLLFFALLLTYLPIPRTPAGGKLRTAAGVLIPIFSLLAARLLTAYGSEWYTYPTGLTLLSLSMISFTVDLARGDAIRPENPLDLIGYLLFFPTLLAGPMLRSKYYFDHTEELSPSMASLSLGIHLYMQGFIKYIALAAVLWRALREALEHALIENSPLLMLLLLFLSFFCFFFFITGVADMARGVCAMYGIPTPRDRSRALSTLSPDRLFYGITLSLHNFMLDYVYNPLRRLLPGKSGRLTAKLCVFVLTVLLLCKRPESLLFALPILLFALLSSMFKGRRLPYFGGVLVLPASVLVCSLFTLSSMLKEPLSLLSLLKHAFTDHIGYKFHHIFETIGDARYLALAMAVYLLLFVLSNLNCWCARRAGKRLNLTVHVVVTVLLFVGFFSTLILLYPQFPQAAASARRGIL